MILKIKQRIFDFRNALLKAGAFGSYFARNIYEMGTVTSGLCYTEDLIFLESIIVSSWISLDVLSIDNSVELYNTLVVLFFAGFNFRVFAQNHENFYPQNI